MSQGLLHLPWVDVVSGLIEPHGEGVAQVVYGVEGLQLALRLELAVAEAVENSRRREDREGTVQGQPPRDRFPGLVET